MQSFVQSWFVVAIGKVFRIHIMESFMSRGWAECDKVYLAILL